ncbi:hypothetical protein AUJ14_06275 [Candidatus Micrarchaeota archaeon CG1_02_55_22]|nr:MAG: hypothetical protein AUJ14_06275 [Candidatus Micrarchaeota archaeon CG1_02_55_22]
MAYTLVFTETFNKSLDKLDGSVKRQLPKVFDKIRKNPRLGKPLHGKWDYYRVRFGVYRITYTIHENELVVLMLEIGKRDEIYR